MSLLLIDDLLLNLLIARVREFICGEITVLEVTEESNNDGNFGTDAMTGNEVTYEMLVVSVRSFNLISQ